jgi:GDP-mannose 6-dehydrogenase
MKINIYGMGYVGCVSAACLAEDGHIVTGIDIDSNKVSIINKGKSPIIEKGLPEIIKKGIQSKNFSATTNTIPEADVSIICVGTPSRENGSLDLNHIINVAQQIGNSMRTLSTYHVVNVRSTVLPGTVEDIIIPILLKTSGKSLGHDFGVCMNPEFMREGTSIHDFFNPPFTIIGEFDERSGNRVAKIYKKINAPLFRTHIKVAEMIKYACNTFHAVKVSFGNEIGNICKKLHINSHEVMDIFCQDSKLNLSPYYLKPGFAFGGSCLPKDLRAITYKSKEIDLELPLLNSLLSSNRRQIEVAYELVRKCGKKKIGILGMSFKIGTDDLRESPMVELIEMLLGKGYNVNIYDKEVSLAKIHGSNKRYINKVIPHISTLLKSTMAEAFDHVDVVVIGNKNKEFVEYLKKYKKKRLHVIDLANMNFEKLPKEAVYEGICW